MSRSTLRAFRAVVKGEQDRIADFKLLGHFGADCFDISCTYNNRMVNNRDYNELKSMVSSPVSICKTNHMRRVQHEQLTFMSRHHRIRDPNPSTILRRNRRHKQVRVADASRDDLDEDLVIFQRTHGHVLQSPILAPVMVGTRHRSYDRSCSGRHCTIMVTDDSVGKRRGRIEL
jgi:hypothetical protein